MSIASKISYLRACIALWSSFSTFGNRNQDANKVRLKIYHEMKRSMVDELLKPWYPASFDTEDGGFLTTFTFAFKPQGIQDKMVVTQARHTWSNAKASELYPDVPYYKKGATMGYHFLRDKLWDATYGGFYTYSDKRGNPKESHFTSKEAYGNAFALYALAAYYHCTGDTEALDLAKKEFQWLETHSHDPVEKGYFQHMMRDGTPIERTPDLSIKSEIGYKDQNSSIHLLEAFTELYHVWPDNLLKTRIIEMLQLIRDVITDDKGNLRLFFKPDWTPVSFKDADRAVITKTHSLDHVSFGHNIETAYLMLEASHVVGIENDELTERIAKKMVDDALINGWDAKIGGFYDRGYYFKGDENITIIAHSKNWWAQAEGLNSLLMMADKYPNDAMNYEMKFRKQWAYIKMFLIDHDHGDWYPTGIDKKFNQKTALKGHIWKGTYHVLRAFINCTKRLHNDTKKE